MALVCPCFQSRLAQRFAEADHNRLKNILFQPLARKAHCMAPAQTVTFLPHCACHKHSD